MLMNHVLPNPGIRLLLSCCNLHHEATAGLSKCRDLIHIVLPWPCSNRVGLSTFAVLNESFEILCFQHFRNCRCAPAHVLGPNVDSYPFAPEPNVFKEHQPPAQALLRPCRVRRRVLDRAARLVDRPALVVNDVA